MAVKEWMEEEQGKHFCHCGCGGEIRISTHHHYQKIPNYIVGHNNSKKKKSFDIDEWIKKEQEKHFCQCGCGEKILITRHHYNRGIPKYIRGHGSCGQSRPCSEATKRKIGEANKGENHWNYGKHPSEETRRKMRENHADLSGKNNPNYGKTPSEETKAKIRKAHKGKIFSKKHCEKISESKRGKKPPNYGKHHSELTKQKMREKRKHRVFPKHHTQLELKFEEMCKKYDLPFRYVGDGQLWIGNKGETQLNPDFIECDGKKIAIFINGDYWHSPLLRYNIRNSQRVDYQIKICKKYKWQPVILWGTDLLRYDAEQFVLNMLKGVGTPK